jgi:hypothetical protein
MSLRNAYVIVLFMAVSAAAQSGAIKGQVRDEQGKPLFGIAVVYNTTSILRPLPGGRRGMLPPISGTVVTDPNGGFQIGGLRPGAYHLCTRGGGLGRVASCEYEPRPQIVVVGAGATNTIALQAPAGVSLVIHVTDVQGRLRGGAPFAIAAKSTSTRWSLFAKATGQSGPTIDYQLTLPKDQDFRLVVDTPLAVTDSAGQVLPVRQPSTLLSSTLGSTIELSIRVN